MYFPFSWDPSPGVGALVKTAGDRTALIPAIRQSLQQLDSEVPVYRVRTLEDIALAGLGARRFAMSLFGVFAALALLLGAVGIYGVMSFSVAQQSTELGVRVAVGRRADLILLNSNPLDDVGNVADRAGVMVRGRWFSDSYIQDRLDEIS
jgi:putative ABC transport system permease protein